jgi:hypothetical protein
MPIRRDLLIGGAGVTALAFAALGYRAWDRGVWAAGNGNPYAPWSNWDGQAADGLRQ